MRVPSAEGSWRAIRGWALFNSWSQLRVVQVFPLPAAEKVTGVSTFTNKACSDPLPQVHGPPRARSAQPATLPETEVSTSSSCHPQREHSAACLGVLPVTTSLRLLWYFLPKKRRLAKDT